MVKKHGVGVKLFDLNFLEKSVLTVVPKSSIDTSVKYSVRLLILLRTGDKWKSQCSAILWLMLSTVPTIY